MYLYGKIQRHYRQTNTEVRRLLAISRSPVFTEIAQTLSGVSSLEAFDQTDSFIQRLQTKTDVFVAIQFVRSKINVWLNVRIDSLGAVVSFFVVILCVSTSQSGQALIEPSSLAVALTYSFAIPILLGQVFNMQAGQLTHTTQQKQQNFKKLRRAPLSQNQNTHSHFTYSCSPSNFP